MKEFAEKLRKEFPKIIREGTPKGRSGGNREEISMTFQGILKETSR